MTTQLDCSVGVITEGSWGAGGTVNRFYEFLDETFDWQPTFLQGAGLRVGRRVARAARRKLGKQMVGGDLIVECVTVGMGVLWNSLLGTSTNTMIAAGPGYQQVHTPTTSDYLPSLCIQKGVPLLGGGATQPHTFTGMVGSSFELTMSNAGILTLKATYTGKAVSTATAYAAPSYPASPELYTFVDGTITIGGTFTAPTTTALATVTGGVTSDVSDWSLTWDNKLDANGFNFGGSGSRTRPPAVGLAAGSGKITAEFDAITLRDAYLNQTDVAIVMTFQSKNAISSGVYPTLQIAISDVRLEGELPKANQGAPVTQAIPYTILDNITNTPLYIVAVTADTAL